VFPILIDACHWRVSPTGMEKLRLSNISNISIVFKENEVHLDLHDHSSYAFIVAKSVTT